MIVSQHPVGPCYLITPWNFPLAMATRKVGPALAAGCTVVIKPAELTPLTTMFFATLLAEAGLPAGVVNVLTTSVGRRVRTDHRRPAAAQAELHRIDRGRPPAAQAGGRRHPAYVDGTGRQRPVPGLRRRRPRRRGRRGDAGQVPQHRSGLHRGQPVHRPCLGRRAVRRAGAAAGRGHEGGPRHRGRCADRAADQRRRGGQGRPRWSSDAVRRGATVLTGGRPLDGPGSFFAPTVVTDVRPGATSWSRRSSGRSCAW